MCGCEVARPGRPASHPVPHPFWDQVDCGWAVTDRARGALLPGKSWEVTTWRQRRLLGYLLCVCVCVQFALRVYAWARAWRAGINRSRCDLFARAGGI